MMEKKIADRTKKAQDEFIDKVRLRIARRREEKPEDPEEGIRESEELLARLVASRAATMKARDLAARRAEERIKSLDGHVDRLKCEITEQKKVLARAAYESGGKGPSGAKLRDVEGLGPRRIARLEEAGITTPAEVAALEPDELGRVLGVSERVAEAIQRGARRVVEA